MKHPLFNDVVTLYHKENDQYTRYLLSGVQWRQKAERFAYQRGNAGVFEIKTVTAVTIPFNVPNAAKISISEGDVIVLGTAPALTETFGIAELKKKYATYCTVRAVTDNTQRPRLRHWKVYAV